MCIIIFIFIDKTVFSINYIMYLFYKYNIKGARIISGYV